jgi:uncharacterized SAM-binding protein YcdF (DUF218 family)
MPTAPLKPRRWLGRIAWLLVFVCALLLVGYVFRTPLLTRLAKSWVVDESVAHADAIIVLGGRPDLRPIEAARLYHAGVAPRILYMDVKLTLAAEKGQSLSEREITRRVLLSNDVPKTAMVAVGYRVTSTYDESRAVRAWLETNAAKSILISTDLFHTRRAKWIFSKQLKGTGVEVHASAIALNEYGASDWWQHKEGLITFPREFVKSIYYWCAY